MHGRVGSAFSNDRFTHRSRIVLFHDGSWCAVRYRSRLRGLSPSMPMATAAGSLCAVHITIAGWWPS